MIAGIQRPFLIVTFFSLIACRQVVKKAVLL